MKTPFPHEQYGFTLIELMVTVALAAIVLTVGIPSFRETIQNNRMSTRVNEFVSAVNLARSEAVKRGTSVSVCKRSTTGTSCATGTGSSWANGWIVWTDLNGNGSLNTNEILRVHESLTATGITSVHSSDSRDAITYGGSGFATGANDTLTFCDNRGVSKARGRVISNNGRLRAAVTTGADPDTLTCP